MRIHTKFGPGLLESVYTRCLAEDLLVAGLEVEIGKPLDLEHNGLRIPRAFFVDLYVENCVIVETKCVATIAPIHIAQLLTYLRLANTQVGLIINFNVTSLKHGIRRVANGYVPESGSTSDRASRGG